MRTSKFVSLHEYIYLLFILLLTSSSSYSQQPEYMTVIGDSLLGKNMGGEMIREVYGHVILTQGNVTITCDKAVQYISRNDAELEGNVVAKQDTLTITTPKGLYFGNERRAESSSGITLDDKKVILTADTGSYYFNENRAWFRSNVHLYDTATTLTADRLTYFKAEDRMISDGTVKIVQGPNIIESDSLEYIRPTRTTFANSNVRITSTENNVQIFGDHLEDYALQFHTIINKNPLLIQIDTTYFGRPAAVKDSLLSADTTSILAENDTTYRLDTLIIRSNEMESFRDTSNIFIARDSVRIVRGSFASKNDNSVYYRDLQRIITKRSTPESAQPVLWNELTQLTGDSVNIILQYNRIRTLEVMNNAFLLSQNEVYRNRFDQISGEDIIIHFDTTGISETEIKGSVLSIYYLYEDSLANGLTKSSSQNARIVFEDKQVSAVQLYGYPKSEMYPENMVEGKELSFTLPGYIYIPDRPRKEALLTQKGSSNE